MSKTAKYFKMIRESLELADENNLNSAHMILLEHEEDKYLIDAYHYHLKLIRQDGD